ncbi:hypothetical protein [Tautonia plasticadhaerens]|uniref:Uncharacterized protein n=1 Tax=Tautonia plasticadhaerens TaxID=2527974 RepID=A0A518H8A9_9BACT|nr:hypothetical protein [Tautonia plasticadhaerens]QDV37055.1 hypothetical protein ElP_49880 [Tautonia plasticadhaerens]
MSRSTLAEDRRADSAESPGGSDPRVLCILVLPRVGIEPIFYYEPRLGDEDSGDDDSTSGLTTATDGPRARSDRLLTWIRDAESHAPAWLRSPISWLKAKLPADERLLMALRNAKAITLVHPSTLPAEEARLAWREYLGNRLRFRLSWLLLDLVILVPSILISVLPGPNVVGLWVAFRVIAHAVALFGISRATRGRIGLSSRVSPMLDGPVISNRREAERVQKHFNLIGLRGRLKRERVVARIRIRDRRSAGGLRTEEARR